MAAGRNCKVRMGSQCSHSACDSHRAPPIGIFGAMRRKLLDAGPKSSGDTASSS